MSAREVFRGLMRARRGYDKGTPEHAYMTRAARNVARIIKKIPVTEW